MSTNQVHLLVPIILEEKCFIPDLYYQNVQNPQPLQNLARQTQVLHYWTTTYAEIFIIKVMIKHLLWHEENVEFHSRSAWSKNSSEFQFYLPSISRVWIWPISLFLTQGWTSQQTSQGTQLQIIVIVWASLRPENKLLSSLFPKKQIHFIDLHRLRPKLCELYIFSPIYMVTCEHLQVLQV